MVKNTNSVKYKSDDNILDIDVFVDKNYETVWLTQEQIANLFERDVTTVSRHISNIFKESELEEESNLQKMQIANSTKPDCNNI